MVTIPRGYDLSEVPWDERSREIGLLRGTVWLGQGGITEKHLVNGMLFDEWEQESRHWVASTGNCVVAAARLTVGNGFDEVPLGGVLRELGIQPNGWPIAVITRLVVATPHRGRGLARALDETRIAAADEFKSHLVFGVTSTRPTALEKLGFTIAGEIKTSSIADFDSLDPVGAEYLTKLGGCVVLSKVALLNLPVQGSRQR